MYKKCSGNDNKYTKMVGRPIWARGLAMTKLALFIRVLSCFWFLSVLPPPQQKTA